MSEQKQQHAVDEEGREALHRALDTVLDGGEVRGAIVLCCAFQGEGMAAAVCALGSLSGKDVLQALTKGGAHLLHQMELQRADQPESGVWQ